MLKAGGEWKPAMADSILALWKEESIRKAFGDDRFGIHHSLFDFMERFETIIHHDYQFTLQGNIILFRCFETSYSNSWSFRISVPNPEEAIALL